MRFCERCGKVIDEFDYWRDEQNCPICGEIWSEDDMTGLMYLKLSEEEKDAYDEQLLNRIKSSPKFEEYTFNRNSNSTKNGGFWAGFRPDKWKKLDHTRPARVFDEWTRYRTRNLPFKPFPEIDMEKAQKHVEDKRLERIRVDNLIKNSQAANVPKCPICQSTDLSRISEVGKVISVAALGIYGADDLGKTYRCNNCGSKF